MSSAMEALCRELADCIADCRDCSYEWCVRAEVPCTATTLEEDRASARADIERRIERAREEDAEYGSRQSVRRELSDKAAELDRLREQGRVMPEGVRWPAYADGEPLRLGDEVLDGTGERHMVDSVEIGRNLWTALSSTGKVLCCALHGKPVPRPYPADSWERLREEAARDYEWYWGCEWKSCAECPAEVGGENPRGRYGVNTCEKARCRDLVARAERLAGVVR